MKRILLAMSMGLLLAACAQGDGDSEGGAAMTAADHDDAQALLAAYDKARTEQNWEVAETQAEKLRRRYPDSEPAGKMAETLQDTRTRADELREQRRLQGLWDYQKVAVEEGAQNTASIYSRTVPVEEGQLAPVPDAQLVLRNHPAWGRSAYLLLAQANFQCGDPCQVGIRFDTSESQLFAAKHADSGKGPALFIEDEAAFLAAMVQAHLVRIELPKGSGLLPSVSFEVTGYDAARYANP